MDLKQKIETRTAQVGVIGLGYVGLPLAMEFARAGFRVTGLDVSEEKVQGVNAGRSHIQDVPTEAVREAVAAGRLRASTDFSLLAEVDTVSICVPTPLRKTRDPDVSYIVAAVEEIVERLHPGHLIVLESTTYPGTTEELILPMLEGSGLTVGRDFYLAFSPERVDPGNARFTTRNIPKVVGGVTPECTAMAAALYGTSVETVVPVASTRVAEMVKLLENTFRSVNIGLVNELALMCNSMGINVWEVIDAAATKPFGFMPFYPGPGLGGHCIPIDPFYLSWKARQVGFEARFIELAGFINSYMPQYVVERIVHALNDRGKAVKGARILVLGVAYKADIDDVRESPALDIIDRLHKLGGRVEYHDPFVSSLVHEGLDLESVPLDDERLQHADLVLITTGHRTVDYERVLARSPLVFDTRNIYRGRNAANLRRL